MEAEVRSSQFAVVSTCAPASRLTLVRIERKQAKFENYAARARSAELNVLLHVRISNQPLSLVRLALTLPTFRVQSTCNLEIAGTSDEHSASDHHGRTYLQKMASLSQITEPPAFITPEEHAIHQQSTPSSFSPLTPVLRFRLPHTSIYLSPAPAGLPSCFSHLASQANDDASVTRASGELFLTEQDFSFLSPETSTGFKLTYPAIALHAVTRSLPSFITPASNGAHPTSLSGCIYCQLDFSTADSDPDDDSAFVEMHIVTPDDASLDQLFDALSQCASLHPSDMPDEGENGSGHPFAGFAPFGTDASGCQLGDDEDDGAFEDAEGSEDDALELSETGRVRTDFQTADSRYRPY